MTSREYEVVVSVKGKGGATAAAEIDKVKASLGGVGTAAEQAGRKVEMSSKQAAFAMRQLPMQMTDVVVGLSSGQSPFVVLMQQGSQLKDMFGGIGPAASAVGGYVMGMVNPFTVAAAAAATLGYGLVKAFDEPMEPVKDLKTAVGDLDAAISMVGKTARDFSMDNLYKAFNKASAGAREGIIAQLEFQRAMIETQNLMAQKSLSKSLEGIGVYSFGDKLLGAWGNTPAQNLAKDLGIALDVAKDMLPAFNGLRGSTEDAGLFMERFGVTLARSTNPRAQQLVKDIAAVAQGGREAAAALSRISEAQEKARKALATGTDIAIPGKDGASRRRQRDFDPEADFFAAVEWERFKADKKAADDAAVAVEKYDEALKKAAESLYAATDSGRFDAFINDIKTAEEAFARGFISQDQLDAITSRLFDVRDAGRDAFSDLTRAVEGWGKSAAAAFVDFTTTGKGSFSDLVAHMLREAATMMVYESIFGPLFGMAGAAFKSALPKFGGGRASGGAVTPGEYYVVGENGPEILVPGISGTVVPIRGGGGAGGGNISISIAVDASGSSVAGDAGQAGALGKRLAAAVRGVLIDEKRPGGLLAA